MRSNFISKCTSRFSSGSPNSYSIRRLRHVTVLVGNDQERRDVLRPDYILKVAAVYPGCY